MMILSSLLVAVGVYCNAVSGSPVYTSSVYLQRGPERSVPAVEYVDYGPSAVYGPSVQYARLAASPVAPYTSGYQPCVSPCVIKPVGAVAQIPTANAKIIAYQKPAPKVAIVPRSSEEPGTYEYSYIVYDEDTGDQKAQHELSDGGIIRGQYSLIQPDGYIREVKYTADDLNGFNAIVKNFLPKSEDTKGDLKAAHESHEEAPEESHSGEHHSGELRSSEEVEHLHASAEVSTDAPEITGDSKIVVTFEDIIRCAQAAIVAGGEAKKAEHGGHLEAGHSEGDGHGPKHGDESHGSHEGLANEERGNANEEHASEKHAPAKSPLTYIILPSLGVNKPC